MRSAAQATAVLIRSGSPRRVVRDSVKAAALMMPKGMMSSHRACDQEPDVNRPQ